MSSIDLHNSEIGIKIVYYGPGLGGKTSSLQYMYKVLKPENRGRLVSLATGVDRTLYFDFLPIQLPKIRGFSIRMSVYTVPGQVHYDATRRLVLQGADGVVFVADSQRARREANIESVENLCENLRTHAMDPEKVPLVMQYNKRDLSDIMSVQEMDEDLNWRHVPWFETCAVSGDGVFPALKAITKLVMADLRHKGVLGEPVRAPVEVISPPSREDDTATIVTVRAGESAVPDPPSDSQTFDFSTVESAGDAAQPARGAASEQSSASLAAAIATATMSATPAAPAAEPEGEPRSEDGGDRLPLWASLCADAAAAAALEELETLWLRGDYAAVAARSEQVLAAHVERSGLTARSLEQALLLVGVCAAHYARFAAIASRVSQADITREEALFCLFFVTDVALRMEAAGIRS